MRKTYKHMFPIYLQGPLDIFPSNRAVDDTAMITSSSAAGDGKPNFLDKSRAALALSTSDLVKASSFCFAVGLTPVSRTWLDFERKTCDSCPGSISH